MMRSGCASEFGVFTRRLASLGVWAQSLDTVDIATCNIEWFDLEDNGPRNYSVNDQRVGLIYDPQAVEIHG